jgi:predicted esterase
MRVNQFIQSIILLFCTVSCIGKSASDKTDKADLIDTIAINSNSILPDSFEVGKIIDTVICKTDPFESYALYIPAKGNTQSLPVVYFFDPHGKGSFPLNKYKSLAEEYNFILIGSNNSKNGTDWTATENIINTLFNDSQKRLKIEHDRIYTCGFSGGAKVASYAALDHNEVSGVIVGGAGLPDGIAAANFNFTFTILSGEGDMNMTDLVALDSDLNKTQTIHRIIFFNGKHEWVPEDIMSIAFTGLQFDAMRSNIIPTNETFIHNYIGGSKKRFTNYSKENKLIKAVDECKLSISMLNGLTKETDWFKQKEILVNSSYLFQQQLKAEAGLLQREQDLKNFYGQQFQQEDMNFWAKTINALQSKAQIQNAEGAMYQRLLAYLSLAFYSITNKFINANQDNEARYFVGLYKLADPTNSDAWYFSAILNARNNDPKATEEDLLKAVQNGFTDTKQMEQQPEFKNLATQIDFLKIEKMMSQKN